MKPSRLRLLLLVWAIGSALGAPAQAVRRDPGYAPNMGPTSTATISISVSILPVFTPRWRRTATALSTSRGAEDPRGGSELCVEGNVADSYSLVADPSPGASGGIRPSDRHTCVVVTDEADLARAPVSATMTTAGRSMTVLVSPD